MRRGRMGIDYSSEGHLRWKRNLNEGAESAEGRGEEKWGKSLAKNYSVGGHAAHF